MHLLTLIYFIDTYLLYNANMNVYIYIYILHFNVVILYTVYHSL